MRVQSEKTSNLLRSHDSEAGITPEDREADRSLTHTTDFAREDQETAPEPGQDALLPPLERIPTYLQPSLPWRDRLMHFTFAWYTVT